MSPDVLRSLSEAQKACALRDRDTTRPPAANDARPTPAPARRGPSAPRAIGLGSFAA